MYVWIYVCLMFIRTHIHAGAPWYEALHGIGNVLGRMESLPSHAHHHHHQSNGSMIIRKSVLPTPSEGGGEGEEEASHHTGGTRTSQGLVEHEARAKALEAILAILSQPGEMALNRGMPF